MKTINNKLGLKTFEGDPIKDTEGKELLLGEAIGNILASHDVGGKMKCYSLGQKLFSQKSLDVDESDFSLIKKACEGTKIYTNLVSGQVLVMLEELKDNK